MNTESREQARVVVRSTGQGVKRAVQDLLDSIGDDFKIDGREVYIKVNGIDFKPFCFTDPMVLEAVILCLYDLGAIKIRVMENCTQGNFTRLVFRETGFLDVCKKLSVTPVYLDEGKRSKIHLENMGYDVGINKRIECLARDPESAVYINIPKLKTHSMSVVTLGIKNQFGMIDQADRIRDHNYLLHTKLVDIFRVFRPTLTIIDGIHAIYNGHYPAEAHLDCSVDRLDTLIAGTDTLAVDTVGAKILGYDTQEVEHLKLASEAGLGCGDIDKINIDGELPGDGKKYNYDILMDFPHDLKIVRGNDRCCREGCRKNTESLLQVLYHDYGGKGGFTVIMGSGFDKDEIAAIKGPVHLAGKCTIEELEEIVRKRKNGGRVTKSYGCNNLAASIEALAKQMGVKVIEMTPNAISSMTALVSAKLHGTRARIPKIF